MTDAAIRALADGAEDRIQEAVITAFLSVVAAGITKKILDKLGPITPKV